MSSEPQNSRPGERRPPASDRLKAIGLMMLAVSTFSALDTSAKYLVTRAHIPVAEVVWARFIGQFFGLLVLVPVSGLLSVRQLFTTRVPHLQLLRSILMVATTALNFLALQSLRLDQTVTIAFLAPLVVALLAGPFLGEWVGWRRLVAILTGFVGVLIAMHPDATGYNFAVVYSLAAMLAYALFMLLTRHMAGLDPPLVTLFFSMFVGTFAGAPLALSDWHWPEGPLQWGLLSILGLLGGFGHWLFLHAYRLAPASSVAPFLYVQLLTMVGFGYLVFGDMPDRWTLTGALIIIASGVYLVHREQAVHREKMGSQDA